MSERKITANDIFTYMKTNFPIVIDILKEFEDYGKEGDQGSSAKVKSLSFALCAAILEEMLVTMPELPKEKK